MDFCPSVQVHTQRGEFIFPGPVQLQKAGGECTNWEVRLRGAFPTAPAGRGCRNPSWERLRCLGNVIQTVQRVHRERPECVWAQQRGHKASCSLGWGLLFPLIYEKGKVSAWVGKRKGFWRCFSQRRSCKELMETGMLPLLSPGCSGCGEQLQPPLAQDFHFQFPVKQFQVNPLSGCDRDPLALGAPQQPLGVGRR